MKKTLFKKMLSVVSLMLVFVMVLSSCSLFHKHSFGEWEVEKEATCTESGERKRACSSCGEVQTERIDAKGHAIEEGVCIDCEKIFEPYAALVRFIKMNGKKGTSSNKYTVSMKVAGEDRRQEMSYDLDTSKLTFYEICSQTITQIEIDPNNSKQSVGFIFGSNNDVDMAVGYIYANTYDLNDSKIYDYRSDSSISLKDLFEVSLALMMSDMSLMLKRTNTGITMEMLGFSNIK